MRAFHMAWLAFFVCFFAWFGIAPLTPILRDEFHLSKAQLGDAMIASVAATVLARLLVGWLVDRFGPRRVYVGLLAVGALPVMGVGLAHDYTTFLVARFLIGTIGASFVVTQCHTSAMFAPNVVGTANATAAGWGNLGGGVAQVVPGVLMLVLAVLYGLLTQDAPDAASANNLETSVVRTRKSGTFLAAARNPRTWALAVMYGACFGVELTIHNLAAVYFKDRFGLGLQGAGLVAGTFGGLALFARALGGIAGDRAGLRFGLRGRATLLGALLFGEGLLLMLFSRMSVLPLAVVSMVVFGLFVHMAAGATYSVVPFINRSAMGSVSGIVGAGGNVGAVLAGLLFRSEHLTTERGLLWLGAAVAGSSLLSQMLRSESSEPADAQLEASEVAPAAVPAE
jgi:NNP family nitrate/nitrite transporter-like MFS transporter